MPKCKTLISYHIDELFRPSFYLNYMTNSMLPLILEVVGVKLVMVADAAELYVNVPENVSCFTFWSTDTPCPMSAVVYIDKNRKRYVNE